MNINEIEKIIQYFEQSNLTKLEIDRDGTIVKMEKEAKGLAKAATIQVSEAEIKSAAEPSDEAVIPAQGHWIRSPLVGTFYASNVEDGDPLVEVGGLVDAGDLLCIIEAMKVMNEIRADRTGKIVSVAVENGEMVEFDQKLFCIGEN